MAYSNRRLHDNYKAYTIYFFDGSTILTTIKQTIKEGYKLINQTETIVLSFLSCQLLYLFLQNDLLTFYLINYNRKYFFSEIYYLYKYNYIFYLHNSL